MGFRKSKADLESMALDAIKKHNLFTITDIVAYLPISRQTFYDRGLDKLDSLKEAVDANKLKTKQSMKQKWFKSDNATLQVALMKLIGDDEDRQRLTQQHIDHTSKGEALPQPQVYMPTDLTPDETGIPKDPPPIPPVAPVSAP